MKIEDILKKQGELYKNLTSNKTIQKYNKTIDLDSVLYEGYMISEHEYKTIIQLEKLIGLKPVVVDHPWINEFEISIEDNKIVYLSISRQNFRIPPEQINKLKNLQELHLFSNQIKEIENLDNLQNLEILYIGKNQITEIKGLENLKNLKKISFFENEITEIKGLDNLPNLEELWLDDNPIKNLEKIKELKEKGIKVYYP